MTISYDFIVFSGRLSEDSWTLGMKAIQGEVPLDVVLPKLQISSNAEDKDIVGVLTKEGIVRESSDAMELYRYLRQLNPKTNQAFGYNEIVIRNIHTRLNSLNVGQELRVQITYTERKGNYTPTSYNIKLLGTFETSQELVPEPDHVPSENTEEVANDEEQSDTPKIEEENRMPKDFPSREPEKSVFKSTNTLEKLITLTRTLQTELKATTEKLAIMNEKVRSLEEGREQYREIESLLKEIVDRLNYMESYEKRLEIVENDRFHIKAIQEILTKYFKVSSKQTQALLKEVSGETEDNDLEI